MTNYGGTIMMIFVVIVAVLGLFYIAANLGTDPYVDTTGNTTNESVNTTQQLVGNTTGVAGTLGTGIVVMLIIVLVLVMVGLLIAALGKKSSY